MLLADGTFADDVFAAAGTPWYFTLFGRDSLWTARFALPIDVAPRRRHVARARPSPGVERPMSRTAAEPGKILHEVRSGPLLDGFRLPPLYYGSVDATPLWISVLHDAWCWGLAERGGALAAALAGGGDRVVDRLTTRSCPTATRAGAASATRGGRTPATRSRTPAGAIADPPITLCEVQGYAYRAALDAARLLDAFDRPGGESARAFAARIAGRVPSSGSGSTDAAGDSPQSPSTGPGGPSTR